MGKGISPLIASVLLLAFSVSIALIAGPFFSNTLKETQQGTTEKTNTVVKASSMGLEIKSVRFNARSGNLSVTVRNTGNYPVKNITVTTFGLKPRSRSISTRIESSMIKTLQLDSGMPWNIKRVEASLENYPVSSRKRLDTPEQEIGFLEYGATKTDATWKTVELENSYSSPVVATMNFDDSTSIPVTARVRNADSNSFEVRLVRGNYTGSVSREEIHYIVMEEGNHTLPDGTTVEAHRYTEYNTTGRNCNSDSSYHQFDHSYSSPPIVLGQLMSSDDPAFAAAHTWSITSSGFKAGMEAAEACEGGVYTEHGPETFGWIAIQNRGAGNIGPAKFETGKTPDDVSDSCFTPSLENKFSDPVGFSRWIDQDGGDGGWYTSCRSGVYGFGIDEDTFADSDRGHTNTNGNYLVIESLVSLT